jgi:probable F420-dependent oxidoreductase
MRFGLTAFCTEDSLPPQVLAPLVEEAGFHLLLFPDHSHVPVDSASRFPGGGDLPDHYRRTYDPLVCCALAAAMTTELRVGVGVALVPVRDPIILAKEVASIDQVSRGRMVLGVGAGWNSAEIENHGVAAGDRWALMREHVLAMKSIWTDEIATFDGHHVRIAPLWSWPKPYQRPHPPIAVGGSGPGVLRRVVEYGDEWLAMTGPGLPSVSLRMHVLAEMAERAGRARPAVAVQVYGDPPRQQVIERYIRLGVDRIDLTLPHGDADVTRRSVEVLADIVARCGPRPER